MSNDSNMNNSSSSSTRSNQMPIRADLLNALIDHAEHGITIAEREGNDTILLYVNQAFEKMTGYTPDECLYKDCRFLQGDDKQQHEIKKIQQAIQDEKPVKVVLRNYRKNGTLFWNDLTITPYFDKVDNVMYYIGVQKDISSFVTLEEELAIARAILDK